MDRSTDTNYINPRVLKARPFTFFHYIFFTLLIIFALTLLFSYFYKVLVLSFKNKKRKKQNNGGIEDCAEADVDLQISLTRIDGLTEENILSNDQSPRVLNSTDMDSRTESPKNRKDSKMSKEEKSELNYYTAATLTFGRGHGSQDHLEIVERPRVIAPYPLGNPNMPMPGFDVDANVNDSHSHECSIEHIQEAWREIPSFINPASLSQLHDVLPPSYDTVVKSVSDPRADNVQR